MKVVATVEGVSGEYLTSLVANSGAFHFSFGIPRRDPVGKQLAKVFKNGRDCYYSMRLIGDDDTVIVEFQNVPLYIPGLPIGDGQWLMRQRMDVWAD